MTTTEHETEQHDSTSAFGNDHPDPETVPGSDPAQDDGLFDRTMYDSPELRLATIDGQSVDRVAVKFSGTVFLDRSDPADIALYRRLQLGHDIELRIEAKVAGSTGKAVTDSDDNLEAIIGEKALKVHSLMRPAGDDD